MIGKASGKISVAVGLMIGGIFLWLALRNVDIRAVGESLIRANLWLIIPFLFSLALFYWLKAARWVILLRPTRDITIRNVAPAMMIGFAGNNILPVRLGELLRIYVLGSQHDIPKSTVLGTIVLERVFDIVSMLILLSVSVYAAPLDSPEFNAARSFILVAAIIAIALTYAIASAPGWLVALLLPLHSLLPDRFRRIVDDKLVLLRQGFAVLTESPGHVLLHISLNSIAQWTLLALCIYISIIAFEVRVTPAVAVLILGLVVAGISLPSAPGFVGTVEYCFVLGLGLFGVGAETALSIGIYYHATTFLSVTLAGFFFLRTIKSSPRELARNASRIKDGGS